MDDYTRRYFRAIDDFARTIRGERVRRGLSQEDVAHAAGISLFTYASLERLSTGSGALPNPKLATVLRICWTLGIPEKPPAAEEARFRPPENPRQP